MTFWTDERMAALTKRWNDGETITAIGTAIGTTRNAVVGKARRMGLAARGSPIKRCVSTPAPEALLRQAGKP